jgi:hypothetical protein
MYSITTECLILLKTNEKRKYFIEISIFQKESFEVNDGIPAFTMPAYHLLARQNLRKEKAGII